MAHGTLRRLSSVPVPVIVGVFLLANMVMVMLPMSGLLHASTAPVAPSLAIDSPRTRHGERLQVTRSRLLPEWNGNCLLQHFEDRRIDSSRLTPPALPYVNPTDPLDVKQQKFFDFGSFPPAAFARHPRAYRAVFGYETAEASLAPLVSVITVATPDTAEHGLAHAATVLNSSLVNIEWIIVLVDDILKAEATSISDWAQAAGRTVRLLSLPVGSSVAAGRGAALKIAVAKWVAFVQPQIAVEPTLLEKAVWWLGSHSAAAYVDAWVVARSCRSECDPSHQFAWAGSIAIRNSAAYSVAPQLAATALVVDRNRAREAYFQNDEAVALRTTHNHDLALVLLMAERGAIGGSLAEWLTWYCVPCDNTAVEISAEQQKLLSAAPPLQLLPLHSQPRGSPVIAPPVALENALSPPKRPRFMMLLPFMEFGGADTFNLRLIQKMIEHGWDVTVVGTSLRDRLAESYLQLTPDVFVAPHYVSRFELPAFIASLIRSRRPHVVMITNSETAYQLLPYLVHFAPDPAYVDYAHSEEPGWKLGGYPRYSIQFQSLLARSMFASNQLVKYVVQNGHDASKCATVHIGLETKDFIRDNAKRAELRLQLGIKSERTRVIFFVARIEEGKLPFVFAETMKLLCDAKLDFFGVVIGDGSMLEPMKTALMVSGAIEKVTLLGSMSSEMVRVWLNAADIIFLPSKREGISLSLMEAMAFGVVPVSVLIGGQAELVDSTVGYLLPYSPQVENQLAAQFAQHLSSLILDEELFTSKSAAARSRIHVADSEWSTGGMFNRMRTELCQAMISAPDHRVHCRVPAEEIREDIEMLRNDRYYHEMLAQRYLSNSHHAPAYFRPTSIHFQYGIILLGSSFPAEVVVPSAFPVLLVWVQHGNPSPLAYQSFVHVRNADGTNVAQGDHAVYSHGTSKYTNEWNHREVLFDSFDIRVFDGTAPGVYSIYLGMFDVKSGERLPNFDFSASEFKLGEIVLL